MKKKIVFMKKEMLIIFGIVLVLCAGTWLFVRQVSGQLWTQSISTMTESIHQGVNALNMQLEMDFAELEAVGEAIAQADRDELVEMMNLYRTVRKDVCVYLYGNQMLDESRKPDLAVIGYLEQTDRKQGILDAHNSSVTGENVFHIFYRLLLADDTPAYLVREYRAKEIAAQFTPSFYRHSGFSYLVNRDGEIMVRSRHRNSNKTIQNLFDLIPAQENDVQIIQQFRDSILELKSGWARFYDNGAGVVFCYEPVWSDSGWMLVSIVAEASILAQTNSILAKTFIFAGGQIVLILAVFLVFYTGKMRENAIHTKELEQALQAADRANNAKGIFLMNMSHDIRTPLNAILGLTAVAQKQTASRTHTEDYLKKINASGRYLLNLVNDVMDMSQIENGKMILREEPVNIADIFKDVVHLMSYRVQDAGLSMEASPVCLQQRAVLADPMRMRQIMINIIDNAIKYTPSGGSILLRLEQTADVREGYVVYHFCCSDTGIGMDSDFLQKVFQPFERSRNTTTSGIAGTGVGLTITKGLLELMGGSILAESEPGNGSVFTAVFPLQAVKEPLEHAEDAAVVIRQKETEVTDAFDAAKQSESESMGEQEPEQLAEAAKARLQQEPEQPAEELESMVKQEQGHTAEETEGMAAQELSQTSEESESSGTGYESKRVLIVEDVELNMEIAEAMIGMTGVQIEKAFNGQEAVQLVLQKPQGYFDFIFMDIQMPVMDGYEATRRIRAMDRKDTADVPIYALSANALAEDIENSLQAGMNGHLAKPIDMESIEKVLQRYFS